MSFSRVAPVGFQRFYRRFDWSRHPWPMAQTAADVRGARGGEYPTKQPGIPCVHLRSHIRALWHGDLRAAAQKSSGTPSSPAQSSSSWSNTRRNTRLESRRSRAEFDDVRVFGLAVASAPSSLDGAVFSERSANVLYIGFAQHVALQETHYYALEDN
jgi:hypothetical protein